MVWSDNKELCSKSSVRSFIWKSFQLIIIDHLSWDIKRETLNQNEASGCQECKIGIILFQVEMHKLFSEKNVSIARDKLEYVPEFWDIWYILSCFYKAR